MTLHNCPICPLCGKPYTRPPAISREDNRTKICPSCGMREALICISMPAEQIEAILSALEDTENG